MCYIGLLCLGFQGSKHLFVGGYVLVFLLYFAWIQSVYAVYQFTLFSIYVLYCSGGNANLPVSWNCRNACEVAEAYLYKNVYVFMHVCVYIYT